MPGLRVIPTRSIPQGVAALVAMNPETSLEENATAMGEAIGSVRTGEVTLAARPTQMHGNAIAEGQPIGLVDGDLVVAEATIGDAVRRCVAIMIEGRDAPLVTLYAGEGEGAASADAVAGALRSEFGVEVEVVAGGQPHYPYLIGVE
jgi:dihydroxyacetone kinase-like predicted kinase